MLTFVTKAIFEWLETLLTETYRAERPYVYDNALRMC